MKDNIGMYQNYSVEGSAELKVKPEVSNMNENVINNCINPIMCSPIIECPQERCVHRQIVHEVPHIQPINTRIINHHIYKHTYSPSYTCTEENEVCNVNECMSRFM